MQGIPKPADDARRLPKGVARLDTLTDFDTIIDVRSPAEFADDHIPGALSCPVLSDEQRAEIGTLYKQVSPFAAKKLGAAYISESIARHLQRDFLQHERGWRPLIVCWRGGMRSGAMVTVLRSIGWDACQLEGGYKGFRQHVLTRLAALPEKFVWEVLSGPTGSAKTRILQTLAQRGGQVLDLEALAGHKGSVLGKLGTQPSQKTFETRIWSALESFTPEQAVFVEAESRKIGQLTVPDALFTALRQGQRHVLEVARSDRVAFLLDDYAYFLADPERLKTRLQLLGHLHGQAVLESWLSMIDQGDFSTLVEDLLVKHYDPLYSKAHTRDFDRAPKLRPVGPLTVEEIERVAAALLALA